jgi:hypothetical protein
MLKLRFLVAIIVVGCAGSSLMAMMNQDGQNEPYSKDIVPVRSELLLPNNYSQLHYLVTANAAEKDPKKSAEYKEQFDRLLPRLSPADILCPDAIGWTPLHYCVLFPDKSLSMFLALLDLDRGIDLNHRAKMGFFKRSLGRFFSMMQEWHCIENNEIYAEKAPVALCYRPTLLHLLVEMSILYYQVIAYPLLKDPAVVERSVHEGCSKVLDIVRASTKDMIESSVVSSTSETALKMAIAKHPKNPFGLLIERLIEKGADPDFVGCEKDPEGIEITPRYVARHSDIRDILEKNFIDGFARRKEAEPRGNA